MATRPRARPTASLIAGASHPAAGPHALTRGCSTLDASPQIGDEHLMSKRWPLGYVRGYGWTRKIERAVRRLRHPEQGAFIAIINAIQFQLDVGADPETVRHLTAALIRFAQVVGVDPPDIHLGTDAGEVLAAITPRRTQRTR